MDYGSKSAAGYGQSGGSLAAAGEGAVQRTPELLHHIGKLEQALTFGEDSLNELFKRIEGRIIRPAVPEPTGNGTANQLTAAPPQTHYAQQVNDQTTRATRIGERIQDLLRRLEV